jgi:hypothetical protein
MATFKELVGDNIVSTGQGKIGEFPIPRTKFGRGNVVTGGYIFRELFEITSTFKDSTVVEYHAMTKDQGVSKVLMNGLVWPDKGMHLVDAHDDIGVLVSVVLRADSVG